MNPVKYVLLVEDDPVVVQFMLRSLRPMDPAPIVVHTENGEDALDYLYARGKYHGRKAGDPSLVLLDLVMPKVDGMEVLRQIKTDDRLRLIPVILLTSTVDERVVQQSYSLGANAFVLKPINFQEFQTVIGQIFSFWMSISRAPLMSGAERAVPARAQSPAHHS